MKLGVWLYLLMMIAGVLSYYFSQSLMLLQPTDKDGNVIWPYQTIPVLMAIGGIGLFVTGSGYAVYLCETELKYRHKQQELNQKEE